VKISNNYARVTPSQMIKQLRKWDTLEQNSTELFKACTFKEVTSAKFTVKTKLDFQFTMESLPMNPTMSSTRSKDF